MSNKKIVTEEGLELQFYPRKQRTVSLSRSADVVEALEEKAKERDMSIDALLRFYIGQGLRQYLSEAEASALALKRMRSRKPGKQSGKNLAA